MSDNKEKTELVPESAETQALLDTGFTPIKQKLTKAQKAEKKVLASNAYEVEDAFTGSYGVGAGDAGSPVIIEPPLPISLLLSLVQKNNTLSQCVAAMEVNVDGTGHVIEKVEKMGGNAKEKETVQAFFKEPYPEQSMITIRRKARRDIEASGNGYIEVIRNMKGDITLLKQVPSITMRLCKLGDPITTTKTMMRGKTPVKVRMAVRARRFVQSVGGKLVYFKEYGTDTVLNKMTGKWVAKGETIGSHLHATEIIHLTAVLDDNTPYGLPRWVSQLPSVLGSRKAEEHNLDFFNSGGLPPVLITISGGAMVKSTRKALEAYLNGTGGNQHRAAILEAHASGVALNNAGAVKIAVERFGADRVNDSMFEGYDSKCEERVRGSFRLPELYVGRNSGNFATSRASSMLAEAQVFGPEREEFDEAINLTLMKELAKGKFKFVSKQNLAKDGNLQMKGVAVARSTGAVSPKVIMESLAEITGLPLKADQKPAGDTAHEGDQGGENNANDNNKSLDAGKGLDKPSALDTIKKMDGESLIEQWAGLALGQCTLTKVELDVCKSTIESMDEGALALFSMGVAEQVFPEYEDDPEGAGELAMELADIGYRTQ